MAKNLLYINDTLVEGIYIDTQLAYNKPARIQETISIPGRNGDLIIDDGVFKNVLIVYPARVQGGFSPIWSDLINWLGNLPGYNKIACTDDLEHFRQGRVILPQTPNLSNINDIGTFDLTFDCKPQRFLVSGTETTTLTASGTLENPTNFTAQPLIRVYGTGDLTINGNKATISQNDGYTDIDCEMMDCYKGVESRNEFVSFSKVDFPTLTAGSNTITLGAGITQVEITPRWWEL